MAGIAAGYRGAGYQGGSYKPLTPDEIEQIHRATLQVLAETGLEVNSREAREVLSQNGARIEGNRVLIPEELVMRCVNEAPSEVVLYGREEKYDLLLSERRVYLGTGGTALNVLDLDNKRRASTLEDCRQIAKLVDALDNIHFFVCPVFPNEVPKENVDVNRFYAAVKNTSKHIMGGVYTVDGVRNVVKMAEEVAGGADNFRKRPFISMITCIMSPLKFDKTYTELMMEVARQGIPVATPAAPLAGATGPVTLAGTLVQLNAEALGGIVLTQLVNPGTPVLYSAVPTTVDIRSMDFLFGSVEMGMMNGAAAQLARYYNLPIYATAGVTDSKIPDVQAGYEKASTAMLAALAGANYIHDAAGLLEGAMTAGYAQYVIDDEIIGMVMRAVRGIEVNKESLAVDVINKVGPGGNYLAEMQTLQHMRTEFYFPKISSRKNYQRWVEEGGKDGWQRATEMAKEILASHEPLGLPEEIDNKLKATIPGLVTG